MNIKIKQKKGSTLLTVLFITVILSFFITAAFMSSNQYSKSTLVQEGADHALYCAMAGVENILVGFRAGVYDLDWQGTYDASMTTLVPVDVTANEDARDATSPVLNICNYTIKRMRAPIDAGINFHIPFKVTGSAESAAGTEAVRVVNAVILAMNPSAYPINITGQLNVLPGTTIDGDVFASSIEFFQPNYSNRTKINGKVYYVQKIEGETFSYLTIADGIEQIESTVFPGIVVDSFLQPGVESYSGATTLSGPFDGTVSPLIYVDGDLKISGQVANASVAILATGTISIMDDITTDSDDVQLGLFAMGKVRVDESVDSVRIEAFMMSREGFEALPTTPDRDSSDYLDIYGSIYAYGRSNESMINSSGYVQDNRTYIHNKKLATNNTIPQMFYFADLLEFSIEGDPYAGEL